MAESTIRQFKDKPTPHAFPDLTTFPPRASPSATTTQLTTPRTDNVSEMIRALLADRDDAADILEATANSLRVGQQDLGPVRVPDVHFSSPLLQSGDATIAICFDRWRKEAAERKRLTTLADTLRNRRAIKSPEASSKALVVVDRLSLCDEELKSTALSLPNPSSVPAKSKSLPFTTLADLPPAVRSSRDYRFVRNVLQARVDPSLINWRRRTFYTTEIYTEWALWSSPDRAHRDKMDAGLVFLNTPMILSSPQLNSARVETAAAAWDVYRRQLIILIRQALIVGFNWTELLVRLNNQYSTPDAGYPRLANMVLTAINDPTLLAHPLLHADVLIYKLDASFATGSHKYAVDCATVEWESIVGRMVGEDLLSLSNRVINGFLRMHDPDRITPITVWENPTYATQINRRFGECLRNDPVEDRGSDLLVEFQMHQAQTRQRIEDGEAPAAHLSCEYICQKFLIPYECSHFAAPSDDEYDEDDPLEGTTLAITHQNITHDQHRLRQSGGRGARERRSAMRLQQYGPPRSAAAGKCDEQ